MEIFLKWEQTPTSIPQHVMLYGPWGIGKTTVARILANFLVTIPKDLYEINASDSRGIDDVREWIDSTRFAPFGEKKVYIIDEFHQMTSAAQSAFLKVLEEPPENVHFFLCTTEYNKIKKEISSRCTQIGLKLLPLSDISDLLTFVFRGRVPKEAIGVIHAKTGGHARDAIKAAEVYLLGGSLDAGSEYIEQEMFEKLLDRVSKGDFQDTIVEKLLLAPEEFFGEVLDNFIDQRAFQFRANYYQILTLRVMRKKFEITPREYFLYFLSIF